MVSYQAEKEKQTRSMRKVLKDGKKSGREVDVEQCLYSYQRSDFRVI